MSPQIAGLVLLVLGFTLAALAGYAWPMLSRLPMYRLRSAIFGPKPSRIMTISFGLFAAAVGSFLLIAGVL